jgi:hypothetical protein
MMWDFIKDR